MNGKQNGSQDFLVGLLAGIAMCAVLGFIVMSILYFTNTPVGTSSEKGTELVEVEEDTGDGADDNIVAERPTQPEPPKQPEKVEITISDTDRVQGSMDALVLFHRKLQFHNLRHSNPVNLCNLVV